jgi:protein KRI1
LSVEIFGKYEELDENDKFLKDYFLKRSYLEKENKSYLDDIQELPEEENLEKQELYEAAYNFRHEEAVAARDAVPNWVLCHSRVVEGSVRKESTRKKQ